MDQNRQESSSQQQQQQQNVHLHMHHVCNCQGGIYPTYYPLGYRTPMPSLVPYAPSAVARPYLQHYQYTQFNVGSQYTVPIGHGTVYGPANASSSTLDLVYMKDKREREDGTNADGGERNDPPEGCDYGQITPPANELLDAPESTQENFVKFLERSCLTAEQIAYRNRNRPCFRNIQNLCIRTRSEILKPCTTISNIHSQGIPWATKDFIYAFVRLTNCWHILKGYWDNRDGSSLGKIEKELTPEFRACYVRWEKETMELAGQLTKIFYNLDTNLNSASSGAGVYVTNNLIPPQVNLMKSASEGTLKNQPPLPTEIPNPTSQDPRSINPKSMRGVLHLPSINDDPAASAAAADPLSSFTGEFKDSEYECEDERNRRVYMKPGSYSVPKKGFEIVTGTSSTTIEFLETAQNVNKAREVTSERYWTNILLSAQKNLKESEEKKTVHLETDVETEWLMSSNLTELMEQQHSANTLQDIKPFYVDGAYDILPQLDTRVLSFDKNQSMTVLQTGRTSSIKPNGSIDSRIIRKPRSINTITHNLYEINGGGLTDLGRCVLDNLLKNLKSSMTIDDKEEVYTGVDNVMEKLKNGDYLYVSEAIKDLRLAIKEWDVANTTWLSQKLDLLIEESFSDFFTDQKKCSIFNHCDQFM